MFDCVSYAVAFAADSAAAAAAARDSADVAAAAMTSPSPSRGVSVEHL